MLQMMALVVVRQVKQVARQVAGQRIIIMIVMVTRQVRMWEGNCKHKKASQMFLVASIQVTVGRVKSKNSRVMQVILMVGKQSRMWQVSRRIASNRMM